MKKEIIFLISLSFISLGTLTVPNPAAGGDDTQYWNEFIFKHRLTPRWETHFKTEQRLVDQIGELGTHNYVAGLVVSALPAFDFELNYKFEKEKSDPGTTDEHRLEIIPILKWFWKEVGFKLRNRLEYRTIDGETSWRLREKIIIKKQINASGWTFTPYFSEELFYDFRVGDFNQNRIAVGVSKEVVRDLELSLYYMYKSNQTRGDWFGANVLGTEFVVTF